MTKNKAKELIRELEEATSGIERLADASVSVLNVRLRKETVTADVVYNYYSDDESERVNGRSYVIESLIKFNKDRTLGGK